MVTAGWESVVVVNVAKKTKFKYTWQIFAVILLIILFLCHFTNGFNDMDNIGLPDKWSFGTNPASSSHDDDSGGHDDDDDDDTPGDGDVPPDDGDGVPSDWTLCGTFNGGKNCQFEDETYQSDFDPNECPYEELKVTVERWWEDGDEDCCTPYDGDMDDDGIPDDYYGDQPLYIDGDYDGDAYPCDGCPDPCDNPVEWRLYDSDHSIFNWRKRDYAPVNTFGTPDNVYHMVYDGTPWKLTVLNGCSCYINQDWEINVYKWTGSSLPPTEFGDDDSWEGTPGFEVATLSISVLIAFLLLKWRKKNDTV